MKLHSLKLTRKELKKLDSEVLPVRDKEYYPYGTELSFGSEIIKKIPKLSKLNAGDQIVIRAKGFVSGKDVHQHSNIGGEKKETTSVRIQLTDIGFVNKSDYDEAFKEASNKK